MNGRRFSVRITEDTSGRVVVVVPFDPDEAWGAKALHHVRGTVNGCAVRVTLTPGASGWAFTLNPGRLLAAGVTAGADALVELAPEGPQRGDLAEDLADALAADPAAGAFFDTLAQFYRKAYLRYIDATKRRPELRAERIAEVTGLLADGIKERPRPQARSAGEPRRRPLPSAPGGAVMIVGTEPVFTVADVQRAVEHYQRLGFSTSFHDETYAFASRDGLTIHLAHRDDPAAEGPAALYVHVHDAEELAAQWRRAGVAVTGPEDFDYGKREGSHIDPDGNKIRFGSPLPPSGTGDRAGGRAEETAASSGMAVILGAVADAIRDQDSAPLAALLDEHVVWEGVSAGQRCEGRHDAMRIIGGFFAHRRLSFDAVEVTARGDVVVVGLRGAGFNGVPGDTRTPGQLFHLMTMHDGTVLRWKSYLDRDEALAAAGISTG